MNVFNTNCEILSCYTTHFSYLFINPEIILCIYFDVMLWSVVMLLSKSIQPLKPTTLTVEDVKGLQLSVMPYVSSSRYYL